MSKENEPQMAYQPVELITPEQAEKLGISTDKPTFISRKSFALFRSIAFSVGSEVKAADFLREEEKRISVFTDLETILTDRYYSNCFVAVGETVGDYYMSGDRKKIETEGMKVKGIRAFHRGVEITEGYVEERVHDWSGRNITLNLAIDGIDGDPGRFEGAKRFAFEIKDGQIEFSPVEGN